MKFKVKGTGGSTKVGGEKGTCEKGNTLINRCTRLIERESSADVRSHVLKKITGKWKERKGTILVGYEPQ